MVLLLAEDHEVRAINDHKVQLLDVWHELLHLSQLFSLEREYC